jgi:hypothetical protein
MGTRTTVQLDRETKRLLDRIKEQLGAKSHAEAIRMLATNAKRLSKGERGSLPKLAPFRREKHDRLD